MLSGFTMPLVILILMLSGLVGGCRRSSSLPAQSLSPVTPIATIPSPSPASINQELIQKNWDAYRQQFIQADGRVMNWEVSDRSTSAEQANALLQAVVVDDPQTFALLLGWAEQNLQRQTSNQPLNHLWAQRWGRDLKRNWRILDSNFASDADADAIAALILASRRWNRLDYLNLAKTKLQDLWTLSTVSVGRQRYLLPGPQTAFQQQTRLHLNPSSLTPYAFRLFAQVDADRNWLSLVTSSYQVLERSTILSTVDLPSNWVALDTRTGQYVALLKPSPIVSQYGSDAYRVWWRVAIDAEWFDADEAKTYLQRHLEYLRRIWRSQQKLPAEIDLQGKPINTAEAPLQYGLLYSAFRLTDPVLAQQLYQKKLMPARDRVWVDMQDNDSVDDTQPLLGLGLLPSAVVSPNLLQPAAQKRQGARL